MLKKIFSMMACFSLFMPVYIFAAENQSNNVGFVSGKDYVELDESFRSKNKSKIEVVEVFSYTCVHCYAFEPVIHEWYKQQLPDVLLIQNHVNFSLDMGPYQRGYYTIQKLNLKDKNHLRVFETIHKSERPKFLATPEQWADFLAGQGIDRKTIIDTYNSAAIDATIKIVDQSVISEKITGTPQIIVDGMYVVTNGVDAKRKLEVANYLIDKVRADRINISQP